MVLYEEDKDKLVDPNNPNAQAQSQQAQPVQLGSSGGALAGSGSSQPGSGGNVSTAGTNAGGGGWTNIQSYLKANEGNTGTAKALESQVGGTFDQESQNFQNQSQETKQKAQKQVEENKVGQDQASQMIQQASQGYNYGGPQAQNYNQNVSRLKGALSAQYQGPRDFAYGMGGETQQYGSGLKENFGGLMEGVYNKAAGGAMGSGSMALQRQLDQDNQAVNSTRQKLLERFSGLTGQIDQGVKETNSALKGYVQDFDANKEALKGYLGSQAQNERGAIQSAIGQWNQEEAGALSQAKEEARRLAAESGWGGDINAAAESFIENGDAVDESTAMGVDGNRDRFNVISDVLGLSGIGRKQADLKHGRFNSARFAEALGSGRQYGPPVQGMR